MEQIKSLSEKRLIVECTMNGKKGNFLIDTGATVAAIDRSNIKKFGLLTGKCYPARWSVQAVR